METNVQPITAASICNKIRMETAHITDTGFPLDVFPDKVQTIVLDMVRHENFKVEYVATAMLSAAASALGGTYRIRVKGEWSTNSAMYIILVGRPGLGKTPPLEAAFAPVRKQDLERLLRFKADMETYKATAKGEEGSGVEKPRLVRTIVSDFTPEALMSAHDGNQRGITILVDEIMGMFNSANRYNNGQLIEQLLTAWSGGAIDVTRVGNPVPLHIEQPCINIIGTTQTRRIHELFKKGYEDNGLLDRILFVLPNSHEVSRWKDNGEVADNARPYTAARDWAAVVRRILALDYADDSLTHKATPHLLCMEPEARDCLYVWYNKIVDATNSIADDTQVESRPMKAPSHVVRLALLLQILRYASGESHIQFIDMKSVKGAIRLYAYFEDSYRRIRDFLASDSCDEPSKDLLGLLPDTFTTAQAVETGIRVLGVSDRSVASYLKELAKGGMIRRVRHGEYLKVRHVAAALTDGEEK